MTSNVELYKKRSQSVLGLKGLSQILKNKFFFIVFVQLVKNLQFQLASAININIFFSSEVPYRLFIAFKFLEVLISVRTHGRKSDGRKQDDMKRKLIMELTSHSHCPAVIAQEFLAYLSRFFLCTYKPHSDTYIDTHFPFSSSYNVIVNTLLCKQLFSAYNMS